MKFNQVYGTESSEIECPRAIVGYSREGHMIIHALIYLSEIYNDIH
jgi:hypothetical protein